MGAVGLIAGTVAALVQTPPSSAASPRTFLYASVGAELALYEVDVEQATLTRRGAVAFPANVQEAAVSPSRQHLYVAWSNSGASYGSAAPGGKGNHGVTAFRVNAAAGTLTAEGAPVPLRSRSIHLTTDRNGSHLIVAYNDPSGVSVHRIDADGHLGAEVPQRADLDAGIYAHHVRVLPSNRGVVLVTRGNGPTERSPEDPGALKVFAYDDGGALKNRASVAPGGGFGFQARHIDFHPSRPWAFLTLERQNALNVFRISGDSLDAAPLYSRTTLAEPANVRPGQTASSIHVHPNGRFVYVGNRASATIEFNGVRVAAGGENTIAVYSTDQNTGEPTLIQTIDTRGYHPRTFALDDAGRILVVGNQSPIAVRDGGGTRQVPASLAVFRVGADGKLTFARKYDVDTDPSAGRLLFWTGMVSMP
jgi:6-phosphogluconolactonase (cycloisomerase 2 family)